MGKHLRASEQKGRLAGAAMAFSLLTLLSAALIAACPCGGIGSYA